jgi:hypothetical protein
MWKEAAVAYIKILSRHLPAGTEEIYEKLCDDSRYLSRDSNHAAPEYKSEVLSPESAWSTLFS